MFTALVRRFISYMYLQLYIARKSYAHAFARDTPILPASFLEKIGRLKQRAKWGAKTSKMHLVSYNSHA